MVEHVRERYLETGDRSLLEKIERYNEDDVVSLQQLHERLLALRPVSMSRRSDERKERGPAGSHCHGVRRDHHNETRPGNDLHFRRIHGN